jgi:predicted NodU family carbamoyl transferase
MEIEGGVFTNLKLNGMVNSFPPFINPAAQNKGKILKFNAQNKGKMNREILLEMYEKLWNADKDKWAWNVILKDTLEKLETKDDTEQ